MKNLFLVGILSTVFFCCQKTDDTAPVKQEVMITVYPNPCTDEFSTEVNILDNNVVTSMRVLDEKGKEMYQTNSFTKNPFSSSSYFSALYSADLKNKNPGIYAVEVVYGGKLYRKEVIKPY